MQQENNKSGDEFKKTLNRIDHLYHLKEFKSLMQSKRTHINIETHDKRNKPADFHSQMRRLLLHMIYLYYVAFIRKTNIYVYKNYCISRYGVIFRYYSLDQLAGKFMDEVKWEQFTQNVRGVFRQVWMVTTKDEAQEAETESQEVQKNTNKVNKPLNPWSEFSKTLVDIYNGDIEKFTPKDILSKLQETKHMKNNVLIVGVLSSTIFPCIKFNRNLGKIFNEICQDEPNIISHIFSDKYAEEGKKDFTNNIIRFFKLLNDHQVLGITSTTPDKLSIKSQDGESLLTEFRLSLGRVMSEKEIQKNSEKIEDEKSSRTMNDSHHNSQQEDYHKVDPKDLGHLKCQYFWIKRSDQKELSFKVSIFINKKIFPLYFREIEEIWTKLSEKWKVILDETKQISAFNPGFLILNYNKDFHQLSFSEQIKCQPIQSALSELIMTTDKLIIATLVMKEIICFYERKSTSLEIMREKLVLNDGRYEDMARSICQSVKNYHGCCRDVLAKVNRL